MVKGVSVHDISKFEDNQSMLGISLMLDLVKLSMGFEINSYFIQIHSLKDSAWDLAEWSRGILCMTFPSLETIRACWGSP